MAKFVQVFGSPDGQELALVNGVSIAFRGGELDLYNALEETYDEGVISEDVWLQASQWLDENGIEAARV
jgi:hypothetical protein